MQTVDNLLPLNAATTCKLTYICCSTCEHMAMADGIYRRQAGSASGRILSGDRTNGRRRADMGSYRTLICTTEYRDMHTLFPDLY
jgi:hypothetical protein